MAPEADALVTDVHQNVPTLELLGKDVMAAQRVEQSAAEELDVVGLGAHPEHDVLPAEQLLCLSEQRGLAHPAIAGEQRTHRLRGPEHLIQLAPVADVVSRVDWSSQVRLHWHGLSATGLCMG